MSQSKINTDQSLCGGLCGHGIVTEQADEVPARGISADRDGRDFRGLRNLARPADGQRRIHLRQLEGVSIPLESAGGVLRRLWAILALELRVAGAFGKEVGKRRLQMSQGLLNRNAGDLVKPRMFRCFLQGRQRGGSLVVAHALLPLHPCVSAQTQHVVVGKTCAAERSGKDQFLLGRWVKPESVGALNVHSHIISKSCKDSKLKGVVGLGHAQRAALSLPGIHAGVSCAI